MGAPKPGGSPQQDSQPCVDSSPRDMPELDISQEQSMLNAKLDLIILKLESQHKMLADLWNLSPLLPDDSPFCRLPPNIAQNTAQAQDGSPRVSNVQPMQQTQTRAPTPPFPSQSFPPPGAVR